MFLNKLKFFEEKDDEIIWKIIRMRAWGFHAHSVTRQGVGGPNSGSQALGLPSKPLQGVHSGVWAGLCIQPAGGSVDL